MNDFNDINKSQIKPEKSGYIPIFFTYKIYPK